MKIVTLNGEVYDIDLERMKVIKSHPHSCRSLETALKEVPTPVVGERMEINGDTTEPVIRVYK